MKELTEKYVFHIPLYKYVKNELIAINQKVICELINLFNENNYKNAYVVKAKGYYKSRSFDEILITIYTSSKTKNQTSYLKNGLLKVTIF